MSIYQNDRVADYPLSHGHIGDRGAGTWHAHPDGDVEHSHEDGYCGRREDKTHCEHWWDGKACCTCGWPAESRP